jgi:hypothetical protein
MTITTTTKAAPLRAITETRPGPPHVVSDGHGFTISLRTVVHTLECGHTTEPYIRDGCRQPALPKRRRCQKCLSDAKGD